MFISDNYYNFNSYLSNIVTESISFFSSNYFNYLGINICYDYIDQIIIPLLFYRHSIYFLFLTYFALMYSINKI